jgi:hypothetical protein
MTVRHNIKTIFPYGNKANEKECNLWEYTYSINACEPIFVPAYNYPAGHAVA